MSRYGSFSSIFKSPAKEFLAQVRNFNPFISKQPHEEMQQLPHADNQDIYETRMLHEQGSYDMFPELYSTIPEMELPPIETPELHIQDPHIEQVESNPVREEIESAIDEIAEIVEARELYGPDIPIEELHDTVSEGFIDDILDDALLEENPDNYMGLYPYMIYDPLFGMFNNHMF